MNPVTAARWVSFDLKTGRRGPAVHTRKMGQVSRVVGEPTATTLDVYCWDGALGRAVPGWDAATFPGAAGLLAVDDSDEILWGGYVIRRRSPIDATAVSVTAATLENYFNRRYVEDHPVDPKDSALLFADFVGDAQTDGPPFLVDAPLVGDVREKATLAGDDKRVLDLLQEFMAINDGMEFTVDPEWTDSTHTAVRFRVHGRPRLGRATSTPEVTFNMPGNLLGGEYVEDYSEDHGANDVMAVSSGEGDTRPQSSHATAILPSWAKFEKRITPSTSITEIATLDRHAAAELAQTWDGLKELSLTARLDDTTSPHVWSIGDDVGVSITSPRFPERITSDGSVIDGYSAVVRAIGWSLDLDASTITPILVERQEIP